MGYIFKVQ